MAHFTRFFLSENLKLQTISTRTRTNSLTVYNEKFEKSDWPTAVCFYIVHGPTMSISAQRHNYFVRSSVESYLKFEGMPNISVFFLWSSEKHRVYHVLKFSTLDIQYTILQTYRYRFHHFRFSLHFRRIY
jgi:hypothetical protein